MLELVFNGKTYYLDDEWEPMIEELRLRAYVIDNQHNLNEEQQKVFDQWVKETEICKKLQDRLKRLDMVIEEEVAKQQIKTL